MHYDQVVMGVFRGDISSLTKFDNFADLIWKAYGSTVPPLFDGPQITRFPLKQLISLLDPTDNKLKLYSLPLNQLFASYM